MRERRDKLFSDYDFSKYPPSRNGRVYLPPPLPLSVLREFRGPTASISEKEFREEVKSPKSDEANDVIEEHEQIEEVNLDIEGG